MANENPEQTAPIQENPGNSPQESTKPVKKDGRKKDPSDPTVVPFQLISLTNRQRLLAIGKPNDETLNMLLDAYERRNTSAASQTEDKVVEQLQTEIKQLKLDLASALTVNSENAAKTLKLEDDIKSYKQQIAEKEQEIAAFNGEIAERDQKISELTQAAIDNAGSETDLVKKLKADLADANAKAAKAEQDFKDQQKLVNGLNEAKRELTKQLNDTKQELTDAKNKYLDFEREATEGSTNKYPDGDILHFFPTITARMLELTAQRLTASRTDGKEITPAMVLGDMFNRYTIDQFNLWFFKWVLSDKDMIDIAQEVEPKITSKKLLRAALGIK